MAGRTSKILIVILFLLFLGFPVGAANSLDVIINEIAWMGTEVSYNDEWIELYNNSRSPINLEGWMLKAVDGKPTINLTGNVPVNGLYLLERSKDYAGALNNKGEKLELYDNLGNLIDSVDASSGWPAGDNAIKRTMERTKSGDWQTSLNTGGTPGSENGSKKVVENDPPATTEKPYEIYEVKPRETGGAAWLIAGLISISSAGAILILKKISIPRYS